MSWHGCAGRSEGRPAEPRRGACRRRLGRHDRVGDDDRGACGGHLACSPRAASAGVHRGALAARAIAGHVRHLVRPRGAGPDPDGGRVRRARRRSWTCRPRSSTSRRAACRSWRSAGRRATGSTPGRRGSRRRLRCRTSRGRGPRRHAPRASGSARRSWSACRCRRPTHCRRKSPATAVERAIADARGAGIGGPALTPWLLARIADLTDGASVRANTALIVNNAAVAARVAVALAGRGASV